MRRKPLTALPTDAIIDTTKVTKTVPRPPPGRGTATSTARSVEITEEDRKQHLELISQTRESIKAYMVYQEAEEFTPAIYPSLEYTPRYYDLMFEHSPDAFFAMLTHIPFVERNLTILKHKGLAARVKDAVELDSSLIKKYGLHPQIVKLISDLIEMNKVYSDFTATIRLAEPIKLASGAPTLRSSPGPAKGPRATAGSSKSTEVTVSASDIDWDRVKSGSTRDTYKVTELKALIKKMDPSTPTSALNKEQLVEKLLSYKPPEEE